jgi:hypothetical protein
MAKELEKIPLLSTFLSSFSPPPNNKPHPPRICLRKVGLCFTWASWVYPRVGIQCVYISFNHIPLLISSIKMVAKR